MQATGKRVASKRRLAVLIAAACVTGLFFAGVQVSRWQLGNLSSNGAFESVQREREIEHLLADNLRLKSARETRWNQDAPEERVLPIVDPGTAAKHRADALRALLNMIRRQADAQPGPLPAPVGNYGVNSFGQLGPAFAEIFGVGAEEMSALQSKLTGTFQELQERIEARSTIGSDAAHPLVVELRPISGAEELRDAFLGAIKDTLGKERYELWSDLITSETSAGPENLFYSFGSKTYILAVRPSVGPFGYSINASVGPPDAVVIQKPSGPGLVPAPGTTAGYTMQDGRSFKSREELAQFLGPFAKHLPAEF